MIASMLIVASPAAGDVLARGRDSLRSRFKDGIQPALRIAALVFQNSCFYQLTRERTGNEHGFAIIAAGQSVTAVDRFLNAQLHSWLM